MKGLGIQGTGKGKAVLPSSMRDKLRDNGLDVVKALLICVCGVGKDCCQKIICACKGQVTSLRSCLLIEWSKGQNRIGAFY